MGELKVGDYGNYRYTITQQMVDEIKVGIAKKQHKKPAEDIAALED